MSNAPFVLVVDDDPDISFMLKMLLNRKGFSVAVAARVEQMAEILRSNTVDLFILDMLLSGSNGLDICKKLKQDPRTSQIPVVMTSAHPDAKSDALAAGADDFISKPFDITEFLDRINLLIKEEHTL